MKGAGDVAGFDKALDLNDKGWVKFEAPEGSELWQILSPVRMHPHGVQDLNRWVQHQFRAKELEFAAKRWTPSLGDESIVAKDKVIQTVNQRRKAYDWKERAACEHHIANGEVGLVSKVKDNLKVAFAGRPNVSFDFSRATKARGWAAGSTPCGQPFEARETCRPEGHRGQSPKSSTCWVTGFFVTMRQARGSGKRSCKVYRRRNTKSSRVSIATSRGAGRRRSTGT